jgi:PAS domain S-box-containing protein
MAGSLTETWPDEARRSQGFVLLDAEGRLVAFDREVLALYGCSAAEIAGVEALGDPQAQLERLRELAAGRVRDPATAQATQLRLLGLPDEEVFDEIPLRDGRVLERHGIPRLDAGGRMVGRLLLYRDVTRRCREGERTAARALRQQALAELSELALNTEDVDAVLRLGTASAAETLGAAAGYLLRLDRGRQALLLESSAPGSPRLPADPPVAPRTMAGIALAQGGSVASGDYGCELRFATTPLAGLGFRSGMAASVLGRDGPWGVLAVHWREPRSHTEEELHFLETVARVLSAALVRREAEVRVMLRERETRAVFEAVQDALVTFDDACHVVEVNAAACALFGRPRSALLGLPLQRLLAVGDDRRGEELLAAVAARGRASGALEVQRADGGLAAVEASAVAAVLPGRHLAVLRDVTAPRRLQAQLAASDRMASIGTLAAGVAHELNNPLAYVSGNLSFAIEELKTDPARAGGELDEALREALAGTDRMKQIIRAMRTFARPDEGRVGPVEVPRVVDACVAMAWNEVKHRATLERELGPVPPVRGSEAHLGQVLLNLLLNAAQAIPEGEPARHRITLGARRLPDGRVELSVADTGRGIAPEHLPRLFDPFFTTRPVGAGTGLGLFVAHSLVLAMGGSIEVESQPGRGSRFRVLLPAADLPATPG